jgi:hypothetical protein
MVGRMKSSTDKLLQQHDKLVHTEQIKVVSHVQRVNDGWYLNTLMLDGVDVPFKYKRKKQYKTLQGQQINITYYPQTEFIAGFEIEVMNVVRVKLA